MAERKDSISAMCQGLELRTTGPDRVRSGALDLPGSVGPCSQAAPDWAEPAPITSGRGDTHPNPFIVPSFVFLEFFLLSVRGKRLRGI